ncbi:Uncharacterised protein [Yersinia rohdei]|uniref:Uncharacterized protein n=1 Tax=Yersinia rohdei TaxID=29485 RepID=A0A0U1HUN4_YERRO|nr:hypothetical protein [Yersinia rohdei]CQI92536.1 Uncharacterised protein [Yersinia rohdei]
MGIDLATIALICSILSVLWAVFRDKKIDADGLNTRISSIESDYRVLQSTVKILNEEQQTMKVTLQNLEISINNLNIKMERVITILEKK